MCFWLYIVHVHIYPVCKNILQPLYVMLCTWLMIWCVLTSNLSIVRNVSNLVLPLLGPVLTHQALGTYQAASCCHHLENQGNMGHLELQVDSSIVISVNCKLVIYSESKEWVIKIGMNLLTCACWSNFSRWGIGLKLHEYW